ncbi:MAG: ferritin family protein [Sedimentisphaerales bacterium]|nr:ferritin family protein [Sedimentisphaerales bacterium]
MGSFGSVNEVLDYAIARELEAHQLYTKLARSVQKPEMRKVLEEFAAEELEHKAKLEAVKAGKAALEDEEIGSLGITDKLRDVKLHENMTYPEILTFAMKKEKISYTLYSNLASAAQTRQLRKMFLQLAQEEAGHKLRFEIEYDLETF